MVPFLKKTFVPLSCCSPKWSTLFTHTLLWKWISATVCGGKKVFLFIGTLLCLLFGLFGSFSPTSMFSACFPGNWQMFPNLLRIRHLLTHSLTFCNVQLQQLELRSIPGFNTTFSAAQTILHFCSCIAFSDN